MRNEPDWAELIRRACIDAALEAYESGGISGLCAEGRWELAVQAMRQLDLRLVMGAVAEPPDNASK